MKAIKRAICSGFKSLGYEVRRTSSEPFLPVEFSLIEKAAFEYVRKHDLSMVSDERLFATILACRHVIEQNIEGDFVECGVFRGGNAIAAKMVFDGYRIDRRVWLFDTFLGMTKPSVDVDIESATGISAIHQFDSMDRQSHNDWVFCPMDEVKGNFSKAGLLDDRVMFVKGDVADTLHAASLPEKISVLRLDTDWYASTKLELEILYPRLSVGGALIIDDYGCYRGAQKATDEYFSGVARRPFLNYSDYTGRIAIKL